MKKTFILAAMAAAVALGFTACGSDDDDYVAPKRDVVLPLPANAQSAAAFDKIVDKDKKPLSDNGKILEGITFTETGNAVAQIDGDYVVGKYTLNGNEYTLTGNIRGKFVDKMANVTKGTSSAGASISINVEITINGHTYNFSGDAESNKTTATEMTNNNDLNNVCRTWYFKEMGLTLYGDVSMSKTYTTGDLLQLGKDANDNGAGLTIDELGKLNKTIVSFEFTKSGKLYLTYNGNGTECASWDSKNFEDFTIDEISDANKFIKDGSKIKVVYNGAGGCTLTFYTKIGDKSKGEKVYEAYLTINLTEAAN